MVLRVCSKAAELSQELQAAGKASTSSVDAVSSHILGAAQGAYSSNAKPRKQEEVIERNWPQVGNWLAFSNHSLCREL